MFFQYLQPPLEMRNILRRQFAAKKTESTEDPGREKGTAMLIKTMSFDSPSSALPALNVSLIFLMNLGVETKE